MSKIFCNIKRYLAATAIAAVAVAGLDSCSIINDDLPACPEGVVLRFVYDYNMEFANAFPAQVDCLTLLVSNEEGKIVTTVTETTSVLADENYRMTIDLPAGHKYHFVAYGGLQCDKASFHFVNTPTAGSSASAVEVAMNDDCIDANPGVDLHPLFYGDLDLTVPKGALDYTEGTVYMLRDTNSIRILLQNVDGTPVDVNDFEFTITADNSLMAADNSLIPTASGITYSPWAKGQNTAGMVEGGEEAVLAFAEFSVGRLIAGHDVTLTVTDKLNDQTVLRIPLINYLLLLKSQHYQSMVGQEYLDRENHWDMVLFLSNGQWIDTRIVINDWTVRLNHEEF